MDRLRVGTWRLPRITATQLEAMVPLARDGMEGLTRLKDKLGVDELYCLTTCQRVVLAFPTPEQVMTPRGVQERVGALLGREANPIDPPEFFRSEAAFCHLCEVATSLDSLVPGEPQVLGQFKSAYHACREVGLLGAELERWLTRVLRVAKRVRTRTPMFKGFVSLISLATQFLEESMAAAKQGCGSVAVVGTGSIGQALLAKLAGHAGLHLYLVSHSRTRAEDVAANAWAAGLVVPMSLEDFLTEPPCLEAVALATQTEEAFLGPSQVFEILTRRCPNYPGDSKLRVLDLALPRNAQPEAGEVPGCHLVQMDDLIELAEKGRRGRKEALTQAREVLESELVGLRRELWKEAHKERLVSLRVALEAAARERLDAYPGPYEDPKFKLWMEQTLNGLIHVAQSHLLEALYRRPDGSKVVV